MKTNIVVLSEIVRIELRKQKRWVSGLGDKAIFQDHPLGYFMVLDGSHEAIFIGHDEPTFTQGDKIKITFERVGGDIR